MFDYINIPYGKKLEALLEITSSTKLAEALEVSRMSLVNWRDDDTKIKDENRLKIDVEYCKCFGFDSIGPEEINRLYHELEETSFEYFKYDEEALIHNISLHSAFGSLEIEEGNITQQQFNKVIKNREIIKDIEQRELFAIKNLSALNDKIIKDSLERRDNPECNYSIDTREIKNIHFGLMSGIRTDAGEYSTHMRIIPGHEDLYLTDARDIPEEMERWVEKYKDIKSLEDVAKAHAHFELIHPFGDGNGRVGRILMTIHCISTGYIPPLINKSNKALYYVFLNHAQLHNEYAHLSYFIGQSILAMHKKFRR